MIFISFNKKALLQRVVWIKLNIYIEAAKLCKPSNCYLFLNSFKSSRSYQAQHYSCFFNRS